MFLYLSTVVPDHEKKNQKMSKQPSRYFQENCGVLQLFVSDQLTKEEGSSTEIPCEYNANTRNTDGFSVVWTLNRNGAISVLASFNGTSHSYQPRVEINLSDFSLMLHDLTANDSGEYLCNISTPHYTNLTVRILQVGKLLLFPFQRMGTSEGNAEPKGQLEFCKILRKIICAGGQKIYFIIVVPGKKNITEDLFI